MQSPPSAVRQSPRRAGEPAWERAVALLGEADRIVLACHVQPDGDALGSALAVGLALRALGRPAVVSYGDDPFVVPAVLDFLPGQELLVPPGQLPEAPDLLVTFDTSSADRLGLLAPLLGSARRSLVVDHHATNTDFGTDLLLDAGAAATADMALDLVDLLGVPLDRDIATCLYTGLITDTGSFRFAATTPEVMERGARLLRAGVAHDLVARRVFDTRPFGYVRLLGAALGRAALEPDAAGGRGLVWTVVTAADRRDAQVAASDVEAVIGTLRVAAEAEVAVVLKEADDGSLVVSTRSKGAVDMGSVCQGLGGGGHRYAAGYTSHDDVAATVATLRAALDPPGSPAGRSAGRPAAGAPPAGGRGSG